MTVTEFLNSWYTFLAIMLLVAGIILFGGLTEVEDKPKSKKPHQPQ
ncbi:MAG TPA: hypothetical protein VD999_00180 [Vitreimonas sp.]|nr:hypothetical protein [Vitreimonas sp.]